MSVYPALSLSTALTWLLNAPNVACHVLSVHERACNLVTSEGDIVALVHPDLGNGPFHVLVNLPLPFTQHMPSDGKAHVVAGVLHLGSARVDLREVALWSPHIGRQPAHLRPAQALRIISGIHRPDGGAISQAERIAQGTIRALLPRLAKEVAYTGVEAHIRAILEEMIGLGPGLTPAGDDAVLGFLAAMWIWGGTRVPVARMAVIVDEVARTATHRLSRAWLRAAGEGKFAEPWHLLARAVARGDEAGLQESARRILETGATSGAFALDGFLVLTAHL